MGRESIDVGHELAYFKKLQGKHRIRGDSEVYEELKRSPDFARAALGDTKASARIDKLTSTLLKKKREAATRGRRAMKRVDVATHGIPEHERLRAEVVSQEFARLARLYGGHYPESGEVIPSRVQDFRDRYFGGRTLTASEESALLSSPAAALLLVDHFERGGIPAIGHESKIVSHSQTYFRDKGEVYYKEEMTIEVTWPDQQTPRQFTFTRNWKPPLPRMLAYEGEVIQELGIRPLSLFESLKELADILARHYGWHQADAVRFVLTDKAPEIPCLMFDRDHTSYNDHLHTRLHLSVFPWVSADALKRLYLEIQRSALGHTQNRATTIPKLKLFDFISERRTRPEPMPWRKVMKEWDKTQPKKNRYGRYGDYGARLIERDYDRVRAQVVWMRSERVAQSEGKSRPRPRRRLEGPV